MSYYYLYAMLFIPHYLQTDEIKIVKDGQYGSENRDIKSGWDGMVGELLRNVSATR